MTTLLLVEANGTIKQTKVKDITFDTLYKKCGFRVETDFGKRTTWKLNVGNEKIAVELWAKDNGKANNENKYDFPPPVDNALYFGTCALIRVDDNGQILDLTTPIWNKIYEILFGGFEDIGDEEEELSEDELEYVDKKKKTKHGYLKDGFVVDSVESGEEDDNEDDDDGDEEEDGEEEEGGGGEYVEEGEDEGEDNSGTELEESEYDYSDEEN
jgi:hypothetical protein